MEIQLNRIMLTKLLTIASYTLMWKFLMLPNIAVVFGILGLILKFITTRLTIKIDKKEFVLKFTKTSPIFLGLAILQILVITFNLAAMSGIIYAAAWLFLIQDYIFALGCFILTLTYYILRIKNIVDLIDDGEIFK